MRRFIYRISERVGANQLSRAWFGNRLLVIGYHGVCGEQPDVWDPAGLHVPVALFEAQLRLLLGYYQPVTLKQVGAYFVEGGSLPERALLVTFDDGYRNFATNALPVLRRLGVPCALYPVVGAVERGSWLWPSTLAHHYARDPRHAKLKSWLYKLPAAERRRWFENNLPDKDGLPRCDYSLLSWQELAEAVATPGVEVGSHCMSHQPLSTCGPRELEMELSDARRLLRERLGIEGDTLAYPHGDWTPTVVSAARAAGYRLAFTTEPRHTRSGDQPMAVPRVLVGASDAIDVLSARLAGWLEWIRPLVPVGLRPA